MVKNIGRGRSGGSKTKTAYDPSSDPLGMGVKTQGAELDNFKQVLIDRNLKIPECFCQHDILRFLRARKGKIEEAADLFHNMIEMRKEIKLDEIESYVQGSWVPDMQASYPCGWGGLDKDGRPVYFEQLGRLDIDKMLKHVPDIVQPAWHGAVEAERTRRYRYLGVSWHTRENLCYTNCVILDLRKVTIRMCLNKHVREFLRILTKIAADCYPESTSRIVIVGAPMGFETSWSVIKKMVDPKTAEKIIIRRSINDIGEYVDKSQLPKFLGGEMSDEDCLDYESPNRPWNFPEFRKVLRERGAQSLWDELHREVYGSGYEDGSAFAHLNADETSTNLNNIGTGNGNPNSSNVGHVSTNNSDHQKCQSSGSLMNTTSNNQQQNQNSTSSLANSSLARTLGKGLRKASNTSRATSNNSGGNKSLGNSPVSDSNDNQYVNQQNQNLNGPGSGLRKDSKESNGTSSSLRLGSKIGSMKRRLSGKKKQEGSKTSSNSQNLESSCHNLNYRGSNNNGTSQDMSSNSIQNGNSLDKGNDTGNDTEKEIESIKFVPPTRVKSAANTSNTNLTSLEFNPVKINGSVSLTTTSTTYSRESLSGNSITGATNSLTTNTNSTPKAISIQESRNLLNSTTKFEQQIIKNQDDHGTTTDAGTVVTGPGTNTSESELDESGPGGSFQYPPKVNTVDSHSENLVILDETEIKSVLQPEIGLGRGPGGSGTVGPGIRSKLSFFTWCVPKKN